MQKTKTKTKRKNRIKGASMKQEIEDIVQKSELSGRIYHETAEDDPQVDRYSETFTIKFNGDLQIDGESFGDLCIDLRENKNLIYGHLTGKLGSYGYIENYWKNPPTKREFTRDQVPKKVREYLKKAEIMVKERKKEYKNIDGWEYKGTDKKFGTDLFGHKYTTKVFLWYNEKKDLWVRVFHEGDVSSWFAILSHKRQPLYSSQYETLAVENTKDLIIDATLKKLKKGDLPGLEN